MQNAVNAINRIKLQWGMNSYSQRGVKHPHKKELEAKERGGDRNTQGRQKSVHRVKTQ